MCYQSEWLHAGPSEGRQTEYLLGGMPTTENGTAAALSLQQSYPDSNVGCHE